MVNEKNILEEINYFLNYLAKNYSNFERIKEENIIIKIGKEKFEKVFDICFHNHYVKRDVLSKKIIDY